MGKDKPAAVVDTIVEVVNGDLGAASVGPVEGVNVGVDDLEAKASEGLEILGADAEVWRTHIGGRLSDDVVEGVVQLGHLRGDVPGAKSCEVRVRPGVGTDLVTLVDHALDGALVVPDGSPVLSVEEEGGPHASSAQSTDNLISVGKGAVVKSQGDGVWDSAAIDDSSNGDLALVKLRLGDGRGGSRSCQGGAQKISGKEHDGYMELSQKEDMLDVWGCMYQ